MLNALEVRPTRPATAPRAQPAAPSRVAMVLGGLRRRLRFSLGGGVA